MMPCSALYARLHLATTAGLLDAPLHRAGDAIGVEDRAAVDVSRRAADGLNQRAIAAQESFLIRVENRDERHLGQVETFAQQVDADEHVELAESEAANDLHPLDGVDVRVHVAHAHADLLQIVGEIFRHALRERRDEHALALPLADADLVEQIVDLAAHGPNLDLRIDQARRPNDLFDDDAFRQAQLELRRRRRHEDARAA